MSTPPEASETPALGLWLRTPWRRFVLALALIVALGVVSSNLALALDEGAEGAWSETFWRNLTTIALWGLLFEPLFYVARRIARWLPSWWLQLVVHIPISVVAVHG